VMRIARSTLWQSTRLSRRYMQTASLGQIRLHSGLPTSVSSNLRRTPVSVSSTTVSPNTLLVNTAKDAVMHSPSVVLISSNFKRASPTITLLALSSSPTVSPCGQLLLLKAKSRSSAWAVVLTHAHSGTRA
jgi:hypothetical protein